MKSEVFNADCLDVMATLPDASIDCVLTDPPYGTTACKWDSVIPFEPMWKELKRIAKPKAAICLFGSQPFTSALVMSNSKMFRYEWIWDKTHSSNFALANKMPMKSHENILVFAHESSTYYPVKSSRNKPKDYSGCDYTGRRSIGMPYDGLANDVCRIVRTDNFPMSVIKVSSQSGDCNNVNRVHPTQKPVELLRYLIRTYTLEGQTVLDFTMGSGSTGVACELENRNFIGIEKDAGYFEIAKSRINETKTKEPLFALDVPTPMRQEAMFA